MDNLVVKWNKGALKQFDKAIRYIEERSPLNAYTVKKKMLFKINSLKKNPEIHAPDRFKVNNNGSYRAFEIYQYRISYWFSSSEIIVTRVRHTKMIPKSY